MEWKLSKEGCQPKKDGEYEVIGITNVGSNICKYDFVNFSVDDGWQIGNNWDVIVWKEKQGEKRMDDNYYECANCKTQFNYRGIKDTIHCPVRKCGGILLVKGM